MKYFWVVVSRAEKSGAVQCLHFHKEVLVMRENESSGLRDNFWQLRVELADQSIVAGVYWGIRAEK